MAFNLTLPDKEDFINEYDIFGLMHINFEISRMPYMQEEGFDEIVKIINDAINEYYATAYISNHPLSKWVLQATAKLNRSFRKYYPQLKMIFQDGEDINVLDGGEVGHKNKKVNSQYPQTMVQTSEAYATDGSDDVGRNVKTLGAVEALKSINDTENPYENVINYILDDMRVCFSFINF